MSHDGELDVPSDAVCTHLPTSVQIYRIAHLFSVSPRCDSGWPLFTPSPDRSLSVDYAPALVGFELQAGRMLPRIQGVVICQV